MSWLNRIESFLAHYATQHLTRHPTLSNHLKWRFNSNDYLALSTHPLVKKFYQEGYQRFPTSSSASIVVGGYQDIHAQLEESFAKFLDVEACLLFSSGYAANLAITNLLQALKAHCVIDKYIHASFYDGLRARQVPFTRFRHNDLENFVTKIRDVVEEYVIICEGIYSMSGQEAPLAMLQQLSATIMIVDEAHSFGIVGYQGRGAVDKHGLTQENVPLRMIPFGKALASQGAVVAGKKDWISALTQVARSCIYSTAISPAHAFGVLHTLKVLQNASVNRQHLQTLITHFKNHVIQTPLSFCNSDTPIQFLSLGCARKALEWQRALQKNAIACAAMRPPTVTLNYTGLRIVLTCHHSSEDIDHLFNTLKYIYEHPH